MSASEIQSWAASTLNPDEASDQVWQRDRVLLDWPGSLRYAMGMIMSSRTSVRVGFLREEVLSLVRHAEMTDGQLLDVFKLLTLTYPRYVDSASQEAAELVAVELVRTGEEGVRVQVIGWLANEAGRLSKRGLVIHPSIQPNLIIFQLVFRFIHSPQLVLPVLLNFASKLFINPFIQRLGRNTSHSPRSSVDRINSYKTFSEKEFVG